MIEKGKKYCERTEIDDGEENPESSAKGKNMHERGAVVIDVFLIMHKLTAVFPLGDGGGRCSSEIDRAKRGRRWVESHECT